MNKTSTGQEKIIWPFLAKKVRNSPKTILDSERWAIDDQTKSYKSILWPQAKYFGFLLQLVFDAERKT